MSRSVRIAVSAACAVGALAVATAGANAALVGEWTFNSSQGTTLADSSGNGNTGSLYGAAQLTPGLGGDGLSLDGQPGGVDVPDSPSLEPASAVTVAAWVEGDGSPGRFRYVVVKGWNQCLLGSYGLYTGRSGGLQFYVGRNDGASYVRSESISPSIWNGAWHLAVGTFDGSEVHLYVDGIEVGSGSAAAGTLPYSLSGSNDLFIGDYPGCQNRTFTGELDDVRIWDTALTPTQVSALMAPPSSSPGSNPAPVSGGSTGGSTTPTPSSTSTSDGLPVGDTDSDVTLLAPHISKLAWSLHPVLQTGGASNERSTISYQDSEPSHSTLTVQRAAPGVRHQGRCVRATGALPRSHRLASCTRWIKLTSFKRVDVIGENTIKRILFRGRPLTTGRYRLIVQPVLGQLKGPSVTVGFLVRS